MPYFSTVRLGDVFLITKPLKLNVMNCYLMCVDTDVEKVFLNKFTAIRALLELKATFEDNGSEMIVTPWPNGDIELFSYNIGRVKQPIIRIRVKELVK